MKYLFVSIGLLLGLALPAQAAIYYASTGGSGTTCSNASPCSLSGLIDKLTAGDTGIVKPGTYSTSVTISGKSGTAANPIRLRAETFAVNCPDPTNDPDGCTINTSNRSILNFHLQVDGGNSDYWIFEGFQMRQFTADGTSVAAPSNNGIFRYFHLTSDGNITGTLQFTKDWTVEHGYVTKPASGPGDYGWRTFWTDGTTFRNLYIGGPFNHSISLKRGDRNVTIERIVCESFDAQCVIAGQEEDDNQFASASPTSCPNTTVDDGTVQNITDQTLQNVTVRSVFARNVTNSGYRSRSALQVDNARDVTVENLFGKSGGHPNSVPIWIRNTGTATFPGGRCGVERGNISIRGAVLLATDSITGCILISSLGESPATVTFENVVCHDATSGSDNGVVWGSNQLGAAAAWETTSRPATVIRNSVFNDCVSAWADATGTVSFTQSHNDYFNCGSSKGGPGAQTADPQFVGPESVPIPTLPTSHTGGKWGNGATLWDWEGEYQPIIDRFDTQNSSLIDTGTGTAAPCTGTGCNIGTNEFFGEPGGGLVWVSCAVHKQGDLVFGSFTNPWIAGRSGLVIDVDCARKRIVVGRCDDPDDQATCDSDIYIHKAAQLRKMRVNQSVALSAGTAGSDADTSGICWRKRATFDFTESLDELTGVWVRYEIDPDGGTHDCTCSGSECPQWAWQGAE